MFLFLTLSYQLFRFIILESGFSGTWNFENLCCWLGRELTDFLDYFYVFVEENVEIMFTRYVPF